jgi:hypothetical protein
VTVNTDNRLVTDTTVSKELWLCHTELAMPLSDIKSIILAGESGALKSSPPVAVESRRARGSAELPAEPHS